MNARIKIKTAIKFTLFYPIKWRIFYCPLANLMEALSSLGLFAMPSLYSLSLLEYLYLLKQLTHTELQLSITNNVDI